MLFKFLGQIIKKDSSENLILTGRIEERKIRRKQRTICLMHLDEWIVDLGQEKNDKLSNIAWSYNRHDVVENQNHPRPVGKRQIIMMILEASLYNIIFRVIVNRSK